GATLALGDIAVTTSASDSMVAAYRLSSLNVINADLTFAAGSTLVTDGTGINMTEGSSLTFMATSEGEKVNLVFTLGTEYTEDSLVRLFSNVDIVKFLMDGEEVDTSLTQRASDFFTGDYINENTTLTYDRTTKEVYLQGISKVVPEPTTATLSLLALAALAARRRRR
ncbi:MAG: PEP-CTERM sorting domain-containing protein, partial [Akkermansia sp.]|nr:PEP-CTERM sorting domain-containing protein [Akkermansia sp.]